MADDVTVVNTESGYLVVIDTFDGEITFTFEDIEERTRDLNCQVTVKREWPGENLESFTERINVLSASAKDTLRRNLNEVWEMPRGFWNTKLNRAVEAMRIAHMDRDWSVSLVGRERRETKYLMNGILLDGAVQTILFGAGGTGKTMLSLAWALAITDGIPEFGYMGEPADVLFVDYEADEDQIADRLAQLQQGSGYGNVARFHYWPGRGSVTSMIPALRRKVSMSDVRLVVVDSAGLAVGGSPLDEQITLAYCSAVRSLGVPVLTLAHVTKSGEDKYPFGSIMWSNAARATINVKAPEDDTGPVKHLGLFFRKMNNGSINRSGIGYRMEFSEDDSMVTVQREEMSSEIQAWRPLRARLTDLFFKGQRFTIKELSMETGEKEDTIYRQLKRMPEVLSEGGRGRTTEYFTPTFISDNSDVSNRTSD
jgi:hypothetical protein